MIPPEKINLVITVILPSLVFSSVNLGSPIFKLYSVFAMVRIRVEFTENQEYTVYKAPVKGEHLGEEKARKS